MDCLFCKIASGEIKGNIVYQDERVTAFRDIKPQAPTHILIIPNEHVPSVADMRPEHASLVGELALTASMLAERDGIDDTGFRLVLNSGPDGGQTVDHLHMHLLGGRPMTWPPG